MPIAASQYGKLADRSRAGKATARQKHARAAFPTLPLQAALTAGDSGATSTRLGPCGDQPRHKHRDGSDRSGFGAPDYAPLRLRARPSGGDRRQYCGSKLRSLALPSFRLALARLRSQCASKPLLAVGRRPKDAERPDLTPSHRNPARQRASLGAAPRPSAPRRQHAARQQTPLACILQPQVAQPWSLLPAPLAARGERYPRHLHFPPRANDLVEPQMQRLIISEPARGPRNAQPCAGSLSRNYSCQTIPSPQ